MVWRRKQAKPIEDLPIEDKSSIEIVAHKDASKEVVSQAKEANKNLKALLEENHFTMTIVLALSGKQQKRRSG